MNNIGKRLIIGTFVFLLISYLAFNYFTKTIGEAFGEECKNHKTWNIDNYQIKQLSCIGWAGPHYYIADLYENGELIAPGSFVEDSCYLNFQPKPDLLLRFDICDAESKLNIINKISNQKRNELGIPFLPEDWEKHRYKYLWTNSNKLSTPRHQQKEITEKSERDIYIKEYANGLTDRIEITYNFKYAEYNINPWYCQFMTFDKDGVIISNSELSIEQTDSVLNKWNLSR